MKIYPKSILRVIMAVIIIAVVVFPLTFYIIAFSLTGDFVGDIKAWILLIVAIPLDIIIILEFVLAYATEFISFEEDKLYVSEDTAILCFRKLQYRVEIGYKDINKVGMIVSECDSEGKSLRGCFTPMDYLEIESKDGKKSRINVFNYSRKKKEAIINEISRRAVLSDENIITLKRQNLESTIAFISYLCNLDLSLDIKKVSDDMYDELETIDVDMEEKTVKRDKSLPHEIRTKIVGLIEFYYQKADDCINIYSDEEKSVFLNELKTRANEIYLYLTTL